jgi:hypothetical protein
VAFPVQSTKKITILQAEFAITVKTHKIAIGSLERAGYVGSLSTGRTCALI